MDYATQLAARRLEITLGEPVRYVPIIRPWEREFEREHFILGYTEEPNGDQHLPEVPHDVQGAR